MDEKVTKSIKLMLVNVEFNSRRNLGAMTSNESKYSVETITEAKTESKIPVLIIAFLFWAVGKIRMNVLLKPNKLMYDMSEVAEIREVAIPICSGL